MKHMFTMVVPEGARVGGTGHLRIVKVCDREVAYSKCRHSICKSEILMSMLA